MGLRHAPAPCRRLYGSMKTSRMLSDRAKWDAGCSVIVAAWVGDVVVRRGPESQEWVSPVQGSTDFSHRRPDEGVQGESQGA